MCPLFFVCVFKQRHSWAVSTSTKASCNNVAVGKQQICHLRRMLIELGLNFFLCGSSKGRLFLVGSVRGRGDRGRWGEQEKVQTDVSGQKKLIRISQIPVCILQRDIKTNQWPELILLPHSWLYVWAHTSLNHPCNHQPRVRRGEEGGNGTSSLPSTRVGKRSQVGEEEEEEGGEGLRLFSSLSL